MGKEEHLLNNQEYTIYQLLKENKALSKQVEELKEKTSITPIRRDDIIRRMEEIGEHNRNNWIYLILRKFGEEFGQKRYQEGYEQGKFDQEMLSLEKENEASETLVMYGIIKESNGFSTFEGFYKEEETAIRQCNLYIKNKENKPIGIHDRITIYKINKAEIENKKNMSFEELDMMDICREGIVYKEYMAALETSWKEFS